MQWQCLVLLENALNAKEGRIGTFNTAIDGIRLVIRARFADVETMFTRAIETDHLVEQGGLYAKPVVHLGLRTFQ